MTLRLPSSLARAWTLLSLVTALAAQDPNPEGSASHDLAARTVDLYERSHTALLEAFDAQDSGYVELPTELGVPCHAWRFTEGVWGGAVERSATARELFAQASVLPAPRFDDLLAMGSPLLDDEVDVCRRLGQVMQVVAAHGDLVRAEQPRQAASDAYTLLRFSRHLVVQGRTNGICIGRNAEQLGIRILRDVLVDDCSGRTAEAFLERSAKELDRHVRERAGLAKVADYLIAELPETVPGPRSLAEGSAEPSPEVAEARALQQRAIEILTGLIEPLASDPAPTPAAFQKHLESYELRSRRLRAMSDEHPSYQQLEGDAYLLTDMALPPLASFVDEEARYREWRDEAIARLAELQRGD